MPQCSFAFCDATKNLHGFPRDPDVRSKWTKFCYRQPDWVPGPGAKICREHFTPESFSSQPPNSLKNCLKKDAVPTLRRGVKRQGSSLEGPCKRTLKPLSEDFTRVAQQPAQLLCDHDYALQPTRRASHAVEPLEPLQPLQNQPPAIGARDVYLDHDYVSREQQVKIFGLKQFYLFKGAV